MDSLVTFVNRYKPYFITDFFLEDTNLLVLNALMELDDLNLIIIGAECAGKTSLMHAIIRNYYGLDKMATFPDHNIMFINNLKEQGIQFFRNEMKSFCQSQSNIRGKRKLIIVDDIDSINEQSQQVFRNYIDKYSNNVQFISACANIQKVNESLQSRLHILKIGALKRKHLEITLDKIIAIEKLDIDRESREFMLNICNDSVRVLINYLEKIYILGEPVTIDKAHNLCSNISYIQFEKYICALKKGNLKEAIEILHEIHDHGYSVIDILDYFFNFVKFTPNLDENIKYQILPFLCKYITIFHKVHEDAIELAFFTNNLAEVFVAV